MPSFWLILCQRLMVTVYLPQGGRLEHNVGQIGTIMDKSGTFEDCRAKCTENDHQKSQDVSLDTNLTHFGPKSDILVVWYLEKLFYVLLH